LKSPPFLERIFPGSLAQPPVDDPSPSTGPLLFLVLPLPFCLEERTFFLPFFFISIRTVYTALTLPPPSFFLEMNPHFSFQDNAFLLFFSRSPSPRDSDRKMWVNAVFSLLLPFDLSFPAAVWKKKIGTSRSALPSFSFFFPEIDAGISE